MVCRENKGRSAVIGVTKAMHGFMNSSTRLHDAEYQSMQHQFRHEMEAVTEVPTFHGKSLETWDSWTAEEQISVWESMRSRIKDMPDEIISEANKYRQSDRQPGVITRIDQEIKRLKTGRTEKNTKLSSAQTNSGTDMLATFKMMSAIERVAPSRSQFLETQARQRGSTYEEVEAEWNDEMSVKKDLSQISLTDDYRDSMSVAGVDAQMQADLGQSGRARRAMAVMQSRTEKNLENHRKKNPPRNTMDSPDMEKGFLPASDPRRQLRCATCGQFGHEEGGCPNQALIKKHNEQAARRASADRALRLHDQNRLAKLSDAKLAEKLKKSNSTETPEQFRERVNNELANAGSLPSVQELKKEHNAASREIGKLNRELQASSLAFSGKVSNVAYSRSSGVLKVNVAEHANANGETIPARVHYFQARPEEARKVLDADDVDAAVNAEFLAEENIGRRFDNEAELQAALRQDRCPNCGRWASLNSNHRCAVEGGPSEADDAQLSKYRMQKRAIARNAAETGSTLPESQLPNFSYGSKMASTQAPSMDENGRRVGTLRTGSPAEKREVVDNDDVYIAPVQFKSTPDGGTVTGKVAVWNDPVSGMDLVAVDGQSGHGGLKCSCDAYGENGNCPHIGNAKKAVSRRLEAALIGPSSNIGESVDEIHSRRATDGDVIAPNRKSYSQLQQLRKQDNARFVAMFGERRRAGQFAGQWHAGDITDVATGDRVDPPTTWQRSDEYTSKTGQPVDLSDQKQVQRRVRNLLGSKGGRGTRHKFSIVNGKDGSITIDIPRSVRSKGSPREVAEARGLLREQFDLPATYRLAGGVRIDGNPAAYHYALDRAAGDPPRLRPPSPVATVTEESARRAERSARAGNNPDF